MPSKTREDLQRISSDSRAINAAARASCGETHEHVTSSRNLIARSFELLSRRFTRLDG
jgi:hypothetical protein